MKNFSVATIPGHRIVRITISGAIALDDVPDLGTAQAELVNSLGYADGTFAALVDVSEAPIQSIDVADRLLALSIRPDFSPKMIAIFHGDGPVKMQVRRLNTQENRSLFITEEEAMDWLLSDPALA